MQIAKNEMSDPEVWDRIFDFMLQFGAALLLGALFFLDIIIMDVHWKKAILISWIVIGCVIFKLGVWTLRKLAIIFTAYAFGYLIGALPSVAAIGSYFSRVLA